MLKDWTDRNLKGDPIIWGVVILLSLLSLLAVYSSTASLAWRKQAGNTEYYLMKHGLLIVFGFVLMILAHKIDYRYLPKLSRVALLGAIPLLVIAFLFGGEVNSASRWFKIPIINQGFQPSDLAKLALIVHLSSILSKNQHRIEDIRESVFPIFAWVGGICGLIALSNFSTAAMLLMTCLLLMVIGRVPTKYLGYLVMVGLVAGSIAFFAGQRGATLLSRVQDFFDPEKVPFQTQESYIAIANGGLFGVGPGNSSQKEILPHSDSDFIYAIIIEEYGLLGGFLVLALYLTLLYRGMVTVAKSENAFGGLLSAGLSFSLAVQAMLNMAVATGLVPVTGQTLPLVSMGGTSLLFTGISLGLILSVSRGTPAPKLPSRRSNKSVTANEYRQAVV